MKRIVVWPIPVNERAHISCGKCRGILDAAGPSGFVFADVPTVCLRSPFMGHLWEVKGAVAPKASWQSWRVYAQPLCGQLLSMWERQLPFDFMWLGRLFECVNPQDRQELRDTIATLALAGGPFAQNQGRPFPLPAKGQRRL